VPDHVGGSPDDLRVDVGPHSIAKSSCRWPIRLAMRRSTSANALASSAAYG
jgi:hypothetical protein